MIPINKNSIDDPFYRYKMPSIIIKKEVNKTVLINLLDITNSLKTDKEYLCKFLSEELGTSVICKHDKISLNGVFDKTLIQDSIYKFIDIFILCQSCSNPETTMYIKNNQIKTACQACGAKCKINNDYKVIKYIISKQ